MSKRGGPYWVVHGPSPGGGPWTGGQCYVYTPFIAYVINLPSTSTHYLELSNFQVYFMIWIVVF